jgi:hypothetical protein
MSSDPVGAGVNPWPAFDFGNLPLSQPATQQLSTIYRHNRNGTGHTNRSQLLNLLRQKAFNVQKGAYVPVGDHVQIPSKLPVQSDLFTRTALSFPVAPLSVCFFSNTLVIPEGFGTPDFDPRSSRPPSERLTNLGHLVVTIEFDPANRDQFEEMFSWTRSIGGKFINSQFANVDRALCRYPEYRGYTVVFSGRTSLHFHFVFRTEHLKAAPWDADAADRRRTCEEASALMHNVHDRYWDCALEHVIQELRPSFPADQKMRSATQWRRMGGGVRVIVRRS